MLRLFVALIAGVFALPLTSFAQSAQERHRESFYLFLQHYDWLLSETGHNALPRLAPTQAAVTTAAVRTVKSQLDQLQSESEAYRSTRRGKEFSDRRTQILTAGEERLRKQLNAAAWDEVQRYCEDIGSTLLSAASPFNSSKVDGLLTDGDPSSADWLWVWERVNYYSGGLAGRSDSWATGPNAVNTNSFVTSAKGSMNGSVFDGPRNSAGYGGQAAGAGWTRTGPQRATYKQEAFHRFTWNGGQCPGQCTWYITQPPPPYTMVENLNGNGYYSIEAPVDLSVSSDATPESGRPGHFLVRKNCAAPVRIWANFIPAAAGLPTSLTWTGGSAGATADERLVSCTSPGTFQVSATVGGTLTASVTVHVVDSDPPPANELAQLTQFATQPSAQAWAACPLAGSCTFGRFIALMDDGVVDPSYFDSVSPYFDGDHWTFRLATVTHDYKLGLNPAAENRKDLPSGNVRPFPVASCCSTIVQAHEQARTDLDTTGLPATSGPNRFYYWVRSISQSHEEFHRNDFYSPTYWIGAMRDFEAQDIEASSANVTYDCANPQTTSGSAAKELRKTTWDTAMHSRHRKAYGLFFDETEIRAHGYSNPRYAVIRNAIPTGGAPSITGLSISSAYTGGTGTIIVTGVNLDTNPVAEFTAYGVLAGSVVVTGPQQVSVPYTILSGASSGTGWLRITTDNGEATAPFTVIPTLIAQVSLSVTGPQNGTSYAINDSFVLTVTGAPAQPVYVIFNNEPIVHIGDTDAMGVFSLSGPLNLPVGSYTERWFVGSMEAIPALSFTIVPEVTLQATGYRTTDSWTVEVLGQPNETVYVRFDGGGLIPMGTTNSQGYWSASGTWGLPAGTYTETWYVGSMEALPTLWFTIVP